MVGREGVDALHTTGYRQLNPDLIYQANLALGEARAYVRTKAPYFCSTIYALRPAWVSGLGTLGVTEHLVCIIDAEWYLSLPSTRMRASCLVHECMHILRGMYRLANLDDKRLANVAGDIPINDDMLAARDDKGNVWELPEWACTSEKFGFPKGLPLEAYYDLLKKMPQQPDGGGSGGGGGGGDATNQPFNVGGHRIENKIFAGGCGGVGGNPISKQMEDRLDIEKGRSQSEVNQIIKDGIREIQNYARGKQGRGTLPDCMEELLDWTDEQPVVPWRELLRHIIRSTIGNIISGYSDFSYRRPAKRSYSTGILRPGMIDREIVPAFIRDTSGSMGKEQLKAATVESCSVMAQLGVKRAWYLDADAAVASAKLVTTQEIRKMPVRGGGGTNFGPALEAIESLRPKPALVVYLTDGDGYAPKDPPHGFEVVWCIVPSPWQRLPAKWGIPVIMSDDGTIRDAYEHVEPDT